MEKKLLVTLLKKNIQELDMLTEGFQEMENFPKALLDLACMKAGDIASMLNQLATTNAGSAADDTCMEEEPAPIEAIPAVAPIEEVECKELSENIDSECCVEESAAFEQTVSDAEINEQVIETLAEEPAMPVSVLREPEPEQAAPEENAIDLPEVTTEQPVIQGHAIKNDSQPAASTRNEALLKTDLSIGEVLANKKVTDIKQAMSIGDRFRFQRELFNGNGEDMNKTIAYINLLATYAEVESFLQSKYKWDTENPTVEDFYHIVRRKF